MGCPGTRGTPGLPGIPAALLGGDRLGKAWQEKGPCLHCLFKGLVIPEPGDLSPTVFQINVSSLTSQLYPPL